MNKDFVHIHNHSFFSKFDGFASVSGLVKRAKEFGMKAVGLTDHGTFSGAIEFLRECRNNDIKPILGMESYLARDHSCNDKTGQPDGRKGNRHLNVIAKNYSGYSNVCSLSQEASLRGYYYDPRIDFELLSKHRDGVIVTSACLSSVVNWNLSIDRYKEAKEAVGKFQDIFGSDFYLEVMFHGIDAEAKIIPDIIKLSKETGVKAIATNDCFVAGTMILTDRGVVPIECVSAGDLAVTHKNRLRSVKYVNERLASALVSVKTVLGTSAFQSTENHPILTVQRLGSKKFTEPEWKKASSLSSKDYLVLHTKRHDDHRYNDKNSLNFLDIPSIIGEQYNGDIYGNYYITKQGYDGKRGKVRIPTRLKICDELLFILGRYIAEGGHDKSSYQISFAANENEIEIQDRIESYFAKFGVTCYRPINGKARTLIFTSKIFRAMFTSLCGCGAENKHLPMIDKSYYVFSKNQMLKILAGYVGGDGHIATKPHRASVVCATTSRLLAYQISDVLHVLGFVSLPTVRDHKKASHKNPRANPGLWNPLYVLHMSEFDIEGFCELLGIFRGKNTTPDVSRRKFIDIGDYFAVKVKSVIKHKEQNVVYNLQVEEDETYVANSYVVHNCHYVNQEDAEYHEIVMCMSSNRCIRDPKRIKFPYKEFYFKSQEMMYKIFKFYPELLTNTLEIADKCDYSDLIFVDEPGGQMLLPKFDVPEEYSNPYDYLCSLAWKGLKDLGLDKSQDHVDRLKLELGDIKLIYDTNKYDFSTYFLVVWDVMNWARNNDIPAGIRGSGVASILLKCLGISDGNIDPIKNELIWERFLGFDSKFFFHDADFGIVHNKD